MSVTQQLGGEPGVCAHQGKCCSESLNRRHLLAGPREGARYERAREGQYMGVTNFCGLVTQNFPGGLEQVPGSLRCNPCGTIPGMDLHTYISHAQRTAEPRAYEYSYLLPGIVGEAGELAGEFAKRHWHGTARSREIVLAYGDIAWLTATLISSTGYASEDSYVEFPARGQLQGALGIVELALDIARAREHPSEVVGFMAYRLWDYLRRSCRTVTHLSWDEVLEANLAKLASRSAKGELRSHD